MLGSVSTISTTLSTPPRQIQRASARDAWSTSSISAGVMACGFYAAYRGRTASCPAAPAQIPACGITAPDSLRRCSGHASDTLAFASPPAIVASEVGTVDRPCMSGSVSFGDYVCLSAPSPCARLARLRVLWADLTPHALSASLLDLSVVAYLCRRHRLPGTAWASQVLNVSLPTCRALRRPRQTLGTLTKACTPCGLLRPLTHRRLLYSPNEAVSRLRGVRHPCGLRVTLCTLQHCCSVTARSVCVPATRLVGALRARLPTPRFSLRRSLLQPV